MNFLDNKKIHMELKKIYNEYKYGRIITQIKFLIFERELESMMKEDCKISGVYIFNDLFMTNFQ